MKLIQFIPLQSLLIFLTLLAIVLTYVLIIFRKRMKFLKFREMKSIAIVGFPNSGKTTLARLLCDGDLSVSPFIDGISYGHFSHGKEKVMVYDVDIFNRYGEINKATMRNLALLKPKIGLGVIDASSFSSPVEKQVESMKRIFEELNLKEVKWVVKKMERGSEKILKKLRKDVGKVYRIRKTNVNKFKKEILA